MHTYKCNFCHKDFETEHSVEDSIRMIFEQTGQRVLKQNIGLICTDCIEAKKAINVKDQLKVIKNFQETHQAIQNTKIQPLKNKLNSENVSVSELFDN